jgi:CMP/dCMP kinase
MRRGLNPPMIIAIDGTAASGKGTLARRIAATYGLPHLDTGLLYRAVGQKVLQDGGSLDNPADAIEAATAFDPAWLHSDMLRSAEAGVAASRIASIPAVRTALRDFQQRFAHRPGGAVLDGRDIGTVIAPEADVKIWITASPAARAHRRWKELVAQGQMVHEAVLHAELMARDARDAPNMRQAPDAVLLDTSDLDIEAVFRKAFAIVEAAREGR